MYSIYYYNGFSYWDISKRVTSAKIVDSANVGNVSLDLDIHAPPYIVSDILALKSNARIYVAVYGKLIFSGRLKQVVLTEDKLKIQCGGLFSLFDDLGSFGIIASVSDKSLLKKQTPDHRDFVSIFGSSAFTVEESEQSTKIVENISIANTLSHGMYLPIPLNRVTVTGTMLYLADISYNLPSGFLVYTRIFNSSRSIHSSQNLLTTAIVTSRRLFIDDFPASGIADFTVNLRNTTGGTYTSTQDTGFWYSNLNALRILPESAVTATTATINVAAGGTITITPANISNIYDGQTLFIVSGAYTTPSVYVGESIVVSGLTSSTFRGTFGTSINGAVSILVPSVRPHHILTEYGTQLGITPIIEDTRLDITDLNETSTTIKSICDKLSSRGDGTQKYYYGVNADGIFYFRPKNTSTYYADIDSFELSMNLGTITNKIVPISKYADGTPKELSPVYDYTSIEKINAVRSQAYVGDTATDQQAIAYATAYLQDSVKGSVNTVIAISNVYNAQGARIALYLINPGDTIIPRNIPLNLLNTVQNSYIVETKQIDLETGKITFAFDKPITSTEALVNFT